MKWYYRIKGGHVHITVRTLDGALAGELTFNLAEFEEIRREAHKIELITFLCDE
jgi:hypothetical protein